MYSTSKSFASCAVGMLVDEGLVKLSDQIVKYFPEYDTEELHPLIREITVRNMLMMATSHNSSTYGKADTNWLETFFRPRNTPDHKPGTEFRYNTAASNTLAAMVERIAGKPFLEYLKEKCLLEIGFSKDAWCVETPEGYSWAGSGVECTLRDLARFMLLFANKGILNGKRYLSEEYAVEATSRQIDSKGCSYGYVGEITAIGDGVTGFKVGQRVSGEGHLTCGHCRNCHNGNIQWCKDTLGVGVDRDGAFAEYVCIPASNIIAIDESLDEDVVAFFDAFGNATHTALMFGLVGEDVIITGAGPIGIIAAGICKFSGARRVIITDVNGYRLDLARKMGVDAAVNIANDDLVEVMHKQGLVEGFDVGLEMSGNGTALKQMIAGMRNGGKIALLGISSKPIDMDMNTIIGKGLTLQGIYGRKMDNWHQMSYMIQGGLDLSPIITHRYHYTEFEKGFEAMHSGNSGKVILDWTK